MSSPQEAYLDLYVSFGHAETGLTVRGRALEGARHRVTGEPPQSPRFAGAFVFDRYDEAARELERRGLLSRP